MSKVIILIWLWFFGVGDQVDRQLLNPGEQNDHIYIVNDKTIFATRANSTSHDIDLFTQADSVKSCNECHDDMLVGEVVHAPAKKDCQRCHLASGAEHPLENVIGFALKEQVPNLCYECHDPKNDKAFVHDPVIKGDCLTCHDIHNSPNMYLVKEDPVSGLCLSCHDLEIPKGNLVHGAVSEGNCTGCHNPHQADNEIFMASNKLDRLCRKCHKSIRKEMKKEFVHEPFKKKDCFSCHNGHSSKEAHLSDFKTQDLCFSCHDDMHNTIANANLVHEAINEKDACLNCHVPHSATENHILVEKEKVLCLSCHDKQIVAVSGNIEAISPHLIEGNTVHAPIDTDGCTACHLPHVSEQHSLLNKAFPSTRYVSATVENFDLCFDCHDKNLFTSPITETATNFRNGEKNLHYLHVQGERGRNCSLCHDMHGSENKYMIKKRTQYGNWQMPIEFEHSDKGGSCLTGCHEKKSYERLVLPDSLTIKD